MEPTVITSAGLLAMLADIVAVAPGGAGVLDGAKLKLFVNDVDPGKNAVIADFTLASFTGSTPIAVSAWGEAYLDANGDANANSQLAQWDYDSGTVETVYGVVLTDAADALLGYARLSQPKEMGTTSDSLAVVAKAVMASNGHGSFALVAG